MIAPVVTRKDRNPITHHAVGVSLVRKTQDHRGSLTLLELGRRTREVGPIGCPRPIASTSVVVQNVGVQDLSVVGHNRVPVTKAWAELNTWDKDLVPTRVVVRNNRC